MHQPRQDNVHGVLERVTRTLVYVAMAAVVLMLVVTTVNVVGRYVFSAPFIGAEELSELSMVVLIFLTTGYVAVKGRHITATILVDRLRPRVRALVCCVTGLASFSFVSLLSWRSALQADYLRRAGQQTMMLHLPTYVFYFVVAGGCALLALALLAESINNARRTVGK